jgi:hypothetical protein
MTHDLLIGREFLCKSNLKLIYEKGIYEFVYLSETDVQIESILSIDAVVKKEPWMM